VDFAVNLLIFLANKK